MLISHPDRTLQQHLDGMVKVANGILYSKKQQLFKPDELDRIIHRLIAWHDAGKATLFFQYKIRQRISEEQQQCIIDNIELQAYLQRNSKEGSLLKNKTELGHHAYFGAIALLSCDTNGEVDLDQLIQFHVIQKHHGNLRNFGTHLFCFDDGPDGQDKIEVFKTQAQYLSKNDFSEILQTFHLSWDVEKFESTLEKLKKQRRINRLITSLADEKNMEWFFKSLFLYSLLLSADKGDVMLADDKKKFANIEIPSTIIEDFKSKKIKSSNPIDPLREQAFQTVLSNLQQNPNQSFYSITLPTGLGKTFAALKAALLLRENTTDQYSRIVYCLPFTSIIDQNAAITKEIIKAAGLPENSVTVHHHLTENYIENEGEISFSETEYMVEGWQNDIIITTFVQLWDSMFTNSNRQLRKFHNLANSIIILDEVQNIPPKYLKAFEQVVEGLAKYFGTRFLFVTATQPVILPKKQIPLADFENSGDYFFRQLNRIEIDLTLYKSGVLELRELQHHVEDTLANQPDSSFLFIFNTVKNSQECYQLLKNEFEEGVVFHLSAGHIPFMRMEILNTIRERLKEGKQTVLVSTQVVEAGVDIDFDIVYRDFAPMDSINQAAGRCNRNWGKGKGKIFIFNTGKSRIYDSTLLSITKEIMDDADLTIDEPDIARLNTLYFSEVKRRAQDTSSISPKIIDHIFKLQFEELNNYPLIKDDFPRWNVYIPVDQDAINTWNEYMDTFGIDDVFKRREMLRSRLPKVQQYVVRIPKNYYTPPSEVTKDLILFEENWKEIYDINTGYIRKTETNSTHFL